MSRQPPPFPIRTVSLREMVMEMAHYRDDEVFRWFQASYVGDNGTPQAGDTMRVTFGQVRKELGL